MGRLTLCQRLRKYTADEGKKRAILDWLDQWQDEHARLLRELAAAVEARNRYDIEGIAQRIQREDGTRFPALRRAVEEIFAPPLDKGDGEC